MTTNLRHRFVSGATIIDKLYCITWTRLNLVTSLIKHIQSTNNEHHKGNFVSNRKYNFLIIEEMHKNMFQL